MTDFHAPPRNYRRIAGIAAAVIAAVVLACFVVVAALAGGIVNRRKDALAEDLSRKLERKVTIGRVDLSLFRGRLEVHGMAIGAGAREPRGTPAALELERASADVAMLDTLLSLGRRPRLQSLALRGMRVNVVKRPDGTLNWQEIEARLRGPESERAEPPDERLRNTVVDDARIEDAEVAFVELAPGREKARTLRQAQISKIDLRAQDAGYRRGGRVALRAAVLSEQPNLELHARSGGAGARHGVAAALPGVTTLDLHLEPTELAALSPFLRALRREPGATLEQGVLSADVRAQGEDGNSGARGRITLERARFGNGERFDAALDLDMTGSADGERIDMKRVALQAAEMNVVARGKLLHASGTPRVQDLHVSSKGLSFDRIHALYPALDARTAPWVLRGPFALTAQGSGTADAQRVQLELGLTQAALRMGDRFAKPAGVPLSLRGRFASHADVLEVSELAAQLADFRVVARGRVQDLDADAPRFHLAIETPEPAAASLLSLLPQVGRALSGRSASGTFAIRGKLDGTRRKFAGTLELELAGLDVREKAATFRGGGNAKLDVRKDGERFDGDGRADFKLAAGRSDVRGSLQLADLDNPQIELDARSRYFDPDDFIPGRAQEGEPEAKSSRPGALARADGLITLRADAGRISGVDFKALDARLRVHDGRATAETLHMVAFGGRFDAQGSELPVFGGQGPYRLRGTLEGMHAQDVLARFAEAPAQLLQGKLGAKIDVTSDGMTVQALRDSLTGELGGRVDGAELMAGNPYAALASHLRALAELPGLDQTLAGAEARMPKTAEWKLDALAGSLRFDKGAVLLSKPVVIPTPQGELSVSGRLSLSDSGKLTGTWALEPKALDALAGRKLGLREPVDVALRIDGPLTHPRYSFGDVREVLEPIAAAYAKSELSGSAARQLQKAIEQSELGGKKPDRESRGAKQGKAKQGKEKKKPKNTDDLEHELEKQIPKIFHK